MTGALLQKRPKTHWLLHVTHPTESVFPKLIVATIGAIPITRTGHGLTPVTTVRRVIAMMVMTVVVMAMVTVSMIVVMVVMVIV